MCDRCWAPKSPPHSWAAPKKPILNKFKMLFVTSLFKGRRCTFWLLKLFSPEHCDTRLWTKWFLVWVQLQSLKTSDFAPASSKEFLDIQATIECGFTLKCVRDITRIYSQLFLVLGQNRDGGVTKKLEHFTLEFTQKSLLISNFHLQGI